MRALVSCDLLSLPHMPFSRQIDIIPRYLALWSHLDKGDSPGKQATRPVPPVLWLFMSCSWECLCGTYSLRKNEWPIYLRWSSLYPSLDKQEPGRLDYMSTYKGANSLQILSVYSILYSMYHRYRYFCNWRKWMKNSLQLNCNSYILNTLYTLTLVHTHTHTLIWQYLTDLIMPT